MKICIVSEFFNPTYGGQYTAVKGVVDICKFKKIEHIVIHKNSKICDDKTGIEKLISKYDIMHIFGGWTPFYIKLSLLAYKLKKKNYSATNGLLRTMVIKSKKNQKKISMVSIPKKIAAPS